MLQSCAGRKHAAPCKQCPHYTKWHRNQILEYQTMNPEIHTAVDVKLSDEFLKELRENLIKTKVIIQDTIKIKSNGNKKFNEGNSETRGIIL